MPGHLDPPVWDGATLAADRVRAIANFVAERGAEGGARYRTALAANVVAVGDLLTTSDDLRAFGSGATLAAQPRLSGVARYLCGPPISGDDLDTIAGDKLANRVRLAEEDARRVEAVVVESLDRDRFSWLFDRPARRPTATEREIAIRWTAGLKAAQEVATGRRGESSRRQQEAVRALLKTLGFRPIARREVDSIRAVNPGEFVEQECAVRGTNCDVVIALRDGRFLLIECKVSNSGVNSYKRLIHEAGQKASHWQREFGRDAITCAVLSGVFELKNLVSAQARGAPITLFWEHRLEALSEFLIAAV